MLKVARLDDGMEIENMSKIGEKMVKRFENSKNQVEQILNTFFYLR